MSQEYVEVVRRAWEAFTRHDNESVFCFYDPEVEIHSNLADGRIYRGLDGVREFFRDWLGVWDEYGSEVVEWIDAGDHVIAVVRSWGRGKQSGVAVEQRESHVWTLRDGKLWRLRFYATKAEALEAAGLRESWIGGSAMTLSRASGAAFVNGYGRAWERWDVPRFADLFSDEVVYVAHPTEETVVGRAALESYLRKEQAEQGDVRVRMGHPVTEGNHVGAEFWVTATKAGETSTIAGCFIARLGPDGRCEFFREYWFDVEGHSNAYEGWGE